MTIMKESVVTENGGSVSGQGVGKDQDQSVTTYFFSSEDTKGPGAGHSGTNGKASEQTIPQNKVAFL